jgi:hypothetical protein
MANGHQGDAAVWKWVSSLLATVMLTGAVSFFLLGTDTIRYSHLDNIIRTRAPYLQDKPRIDDQFSSLHAEIIRIRQHLEQLDRAIRFKE